MTFYEIFDAWADSANAEAADVMRSGNYEDMVQNIMDYADGALDIPLEKSQACIIINAYNDWKNAEPDRTADTSSYMHVLKAIEFGPEGLDRQVVTVVTDRPDLAKRPDGATVVSEIVAIGKDEEAGRDAAEDRIFHQGSISNIIPQCYFSTVAYLPDYDGQETDEFAAAHPDAMREAMEEFLDPLSFDGILYFVPINGGKSGDIYDVVYGKK